MPDLTLADTITTPVYSLDYLSELSVENALASRTILAIEVPTDSFWMAQLNSLTNDDMLVPVYKAHDDSRRGIFYVPQPGSFKLTIRISRPNPSDERLEWEPPHCYMYWSMGHSLRVMSEGGSTAYDQMRRFCGLNGLEIPGWDFANSHGSSFDPVPISKHADSVFFESTVHFEVQGLLSNAQVREQMAALARQVFGPSASMFRDSGISALGFWAKDGIVGKTPGTPTYQPQFEHCKLQYSDYYGNLHGAACSAIKGPVYRWTSYTQSRQEWMPSAEALTRCVNRKTIRVYGDSLSAALFRNLICLLDGYASLTKGIDYSLEHHQIQTEIGPFYAPREAQSEVSYPDSEKLLWTNDAYGTVDIELWLFGMWPISYIPSSEWARGHDQTLRHIKHHADRRKVKATIITATSPQSDPSHPTEPMWQTVDRAHLWNALLRDAARHHDLPLIDVFWPTATRFDARIDNCHFCECVSCACQTRCKC